MDELPEGQHLMKLDLDSIKKNSSVLNPTGRVNMSVMK